MPTLPGHQHTQPRIRRAGCASDRPHRPGTRLPFFVCGLHRQGGGGAAAVFCLLAPPPNNTHRLPPKSPSEAGGHKHGLRGGGRGGRHGERGVGAGPTQNTQRRRRVLARFFGRGSPPRARFRRCADAKRKRGPPARPLAARALCHRISLAQSLLLSDAPSPDLTECHGDDGRRGGVGCPPARAGRWRGRADGRAGEGKWTGSGGPGGRALWRAWTRPGGGCLGGCVRRKRGRGREGAHARGATPRSPPPPSVLLNLPQPPPSFFSQVVDPWTVAAGADGRIDYDKLTREVRSERTGKQGRRLPPAGPFLLLSPSCHPSHPLTLSLSLSLSAPRTHTTVWLLPNRRRPHQAVR